jgi:hypothetical protein
MGIPEVTAGWETTRKTAETRREHTHQQTAKNHPHAAPHALAIPKAATKPQRESSGLANARAPHTPYSAWYASREFSLELQIIQHFILRYRSARSAKRF